MNRLLPLALAFFANVAPALADRMPSEPERTRIEAELRNNGYVNWGEIELDDGVWKVGDARAADGYSYDLVLDPSTFRVIGKERD